MPKNKYILLIFLFIAINCWLVFFIFGNTEKELFGKPIPLEVQNVTLFPDQALLQSAVLLSLKRGDTTLLFTGFPASILPNSVKVATESNVGVTGCIFRNSENEAHNQNLKAKKDSLSLLEDSLANLLIRKNALEKELELLLYNKSTFSGISSAEKAKEMADFFRNRSIEIQQELKRYAFLSTQLQNNCQDLKSEIQKQSPKGGELLVHLSVFETGKINLNLSYLVKEAGWKAVSDLKAQSDKGSVQIFQRAAIYQQTGLNWRNVKLTLHSGSPQNHQIKPEILNRRLSLKSDENSSDPSEKVLEKLADTKIQKDNSSQRIYTSPALPEQNTEVKELSKPLPLTAVEKTIQESEILSATPAREFEIAQKVSLASGKKVKWIELSTKRMQSNFIYCLIPTLQPAAFVQVRLAAQDLGLGLENKINIYLNGEFTGEESFSADADSLLFTLGKTKEISAVRKLKNKSGNSNNGLTLEEYTWQLRVLNASKAEIDVRVEEGLPLSADAAVLVELKEAAEAGMDTAKSLLRWNLKLKAGEEKELSYTYAVSYPEKASLRVN